MKSLKLGLTALVMLMSAAAFSQTDSAKSATATSDTATQSQPVTGEKSTTTGSMNTTGQATGTTSTTTGTSTTGTTSESTFSTPKPNFGRYYIAVLGNYQSAESTTDSKSVKITPDETNPGKVWVEGLTDEKFYALLKTAPGTYKIPAQTQAEKKIQEGTLVYQEDSKQINICLGCGYNSENPSATPAESATTTDESTASTTKSKTKKTAKVKKPTITVINFSGTKTDQGTASIGQ